MTSSPLPRTPFLIWSQLGEMLKMQKGWPVPRRPVISMPPIKTEYPTSDTNCCRSLIFKGIEHSQLSRVIRNSLLEKNGHLCSEESWLFWERVRLSSLTETVLNPPYALKLLDNISEKGRDREHKENSVVLRLFLRSINKVQVQVVSACNDPSFKLKQWTH